MNRPNRLPWAVLLLLSGWSLGCGTPVKTVVYEFVDPQAAAAATPEEIEKLRYRIDRRVNADIKCARVRATDDGKWALDFLADRPAEEAAARRRLSTRGLLEFRLLAERDRDAALVPIAESAATKSVTGPDGKPLAEWVPLVRKLDGSMREALLDPTRFVTRKDAAGHVEALTLIPPEPITQANLQRDLRVKRNRAKIFFGEDEAGRPGIQFNLDPDGGIRLGKLTEERLAVPGQGPSRLGIVVDGELRSTAELTHPWLSTGVIPGDFTPQEQLDFLAIFSQGDLPSAMRPVDATPSTQPGPQP